MRIAVFGGSFDPVHNEHIRVAEKAIQTLGLDKLVVMPANIPPHKKSERLSFGETRLEMCKRAFAHLEKVEVSTNWKRAVQVIPLKPAVIIKRNTPTRSCFGL